MMQRFYDLNFFLNKLDSVLICIWSV